MCTLCLLPLPPCKRAADADDGKKKKNQSLHQLNFYAALRGWGDKQDMRASLVLEKGICCNMKVLADLRVIQTGLDGMSVKEIMFLSNSHSFLMS